MKLSALASMIKEAGHCILIRTQNDRVFISTNYALYSMDGYPKTKNKGELAAMLGIPEKKMQNIYFEEKKAENNRYYGASLDDDPDEESPAEKLNTRLVINGDEHLALRHDDGRIGFIRTELLRPVESELTKEYAAICVRENRLNKDAPIYAVKDGMYLRALIMPAKVGESTADELNEILANLREQQTAKMMKESLEEKEQ